MVTMEGAAAAFCETLTDEQDEMAREMVGRVSSKWSLSVLYALAEAKRPLRFSRVMEQVEGVSQKVLTQTLRMLEREGLVTRTIYAQVPPRVEYELTSLGLELLQQILPLWRWIVERIPVFEAARAKSRETLTEA